MKELNLVYNFLQETYVYFEGQKGMPQRNRREWGREGLLEGLREIVDLNRKSVIHLQGIPGDVFGEIYNLFKKTSVSLDLEKRL